MNHKKEKELYKMADKFVLEGLDLQIQRYEIEKVRYLKKFKECKKNYPMIKIISDIPGIGEIGAMKLVSRIVDAHRFQTRNHFLSYCGLIKLEKMSGGRSYGKKNPRFCRMMKGVFKTATPPCFRNVDHWIKILLFQIGAEWNFNDLRKKI